MHTLQNPVCVGLLIVSGGVKKCLRKCLHRARTLGDPRAPAVQYALLITLPLTFSHTVTRTPPRCDIFGIMRLHISLMKNVGAGCLEGKKGSSKDR